MSITTLSIVGAVTPVLLYLILAIRAKNTQLRHLQLRCEGMKYQVETSDAAAAYLNSKVKGMREELDEIHNSEEES